MTIDIFLTVKQKCLNGLNHIIIKLHVNIDHQSQPRICVAYSGLTSIGKITLTCYMQKNESQGR